MNKKNLIKLIIMGVNLIFGGILVLDSIISGDPHWAFIIGMATAAGAIIQLWSFKEALLGKSILGLIIFLVVVIVLATVLASNSWPAAIITVALWGICLFKAITGLKTHPEEDASIES